MTSPACSPVISQTPTSSLPQSTTKDSKMMILKPSNCSNSRALSYISPIHHKSTIFSVSQSQTQPSSLNLKVTPSVFFPSPKPMQPPHSFLYNPFIAQTNSQNSPPMSILDTLFHHHQAINIIHQFILFLLMYMHNLLSLS